jgi:hypothetical protein
LLVFNSLSLGFRGGEQKLEEVGKYWFCHEDAAITSIQTLGWAFGEPLHVRCGISSSGMVSGERWLH